MTTIPRKTLLLAILLLLVLAGVIASALRRPGNAADDTRTNVVHTMVATMDGVLQRIGLAAASPERHVQPRGWPSIAWLLGLGLVAVWVLRRREPQAQQQSRSKRS